MKEYKISDLFEYFDKGKISSLNKVNAGIYPCISCSGINSGITKYIDKYDYDTEQLGFPLVSVPGTGDIYYCFVHIGKFSVTNLTHLLKLKQANLNSILGVFAFLLTETFIKRYNYGNILNKERLMNETIDLPVVVRGLTKNEMNDITNGLVSIDELTNNAKNSKYEYELNGNLLNHYVYTNLMK